MFVAIVFKHPGSSHTLERPGAVTGPTRDATIKRALKLRNEWAHPEYRIMVGELTTEVVEPVRYEEVPLEDQREMLSRSHC